MNHLNGNAEQENPFAMDLLTANTQFDEVLPEPVRVSIIKFDTHKTGEFDAHGNEIVTRTPRIRHALINTYVPMTVLHSMMRSQAKLRGAQDLQVQAAKGELSSENQEFMLKWMTEQVLAVWQLTEPHMTLEELAEGLNYQKIFGLFGLFFGDLLKQLSNQAKKG